jgi:hypothetical protein
MELQTLTQFLGKSHALQLMLVSAGLRPAVRFAVEGDLISAAFEVVERLGLRAIVGFDSVKPHRVVGRGGYSEWAGRGPARASDLMGRRYLYVGLDTRHAQRLRRADEAGDDYETGLLLGYPSCCVEGFNRASAQGSSTLSDPVLERYNDSVAIAWQLNVSLLCYGIALIMYVPCSQSCRAALAQADVFFEFLSTQHTTAAQELKRDLATFVVHTDICGISSFAGTDLRDGSVSIVEIRHSMQNAIVGSLMKVGDRVASDGRYLTIGTFDFPRKTAAFFRFT